MNKLSTEPLRDVAKVRAVEDSLMLSLLKNNLLVKDSFGCYITCGTVGWMAEPKARLVLEVMLSFQQV